MTPPKRPLFRPRRELTLLESYAAYLLHHAGWERYKPQCLTLFVQSGFVENVVKGKFCPTTVPYDDMIGGVYLRVTEAISRKMVRPSSGFGGYINYLQATCRGAALDALRQKTDQAFLFPDAADDRVCQLDDLKLRGYDIVSFVERVAKRAVRFDGWEREVAGVIIDGLIQGLDKPEIRGVLSDIEEPVFFQLFNYSMVLVAWARDAYRRQ